MTESDNTRLTRGGSSEIPVTIERYREEYDEADKFSRKVANYINEVAIPANNQLRYAGHHLLLALGDDGALCNEDQLRRAIYHCQRAKFEAAESGIVSALDNIELFRYEYRRTVVTDIVPNYIEIKRIARDAGQLLEQSREPKDKADFHSALMKMFETVSEAADILDNSREDVNKKVRTERRTFVMRAGGILIGLLSLTLVILGLVLTHTI